MVRTVLGVLLVAVVLAASGCSSATSSTDQPDAGQQADASRPTEAQAQAAVIEIATGTYEESMWASATVKGIGLDASGVWWVQAWTSTGSEGDDSEQWFVTYDGASWTYQGSGTGMERSDLPSDIAWEDVE